MKKWKKLRAAALVAVMTILATLGPGNVLAESASGISVTPEEMIRTVENVARSIGDYELEVEIRDGLLTGVRIGTKDEYVSVGEIRELYQSTIVTGTVVVAEANGNLATDEAPICTGDIVTVRPDQGQEIEGVVLIPGDVLGTGLISISQLTRIARALSGTEPLSGIYLKAADLNGSGAPDVSDLAFEAKLLADPSTPLPNDPEKPDEPEVPVGPVANEMCAQAAAQIVARTNELRASHGMAPLPTNAVLTEGAQWRADEVAETDLFSHTRPNGEPYYTAHDWPTGWQARGENLGFLRSIAGLSAKEIGDLLFDHLSESPEHEAIMLNSNYNMVGIAVAFAPNGSAFAAQWFAG